MGSLSVDYAALIHDLDNPDAAKVGRALIAALGDSYQASHENCAILELNQAGAHFIFDLASSAGYQQEDRTIAASAPTPELVNKRDANYQGGFPMDHASGVRPVDRGHLIPHLSGREFGPNIFRQDRELNRGWSAQGKRYRALEREAACVPGTMYFGHLIYSDDSAYPSEIEVGLLRDTELYVERFDNCPPDDLPAR